MAWTGNFKTRIEDLAGTLAVSDDAALEQWLLDGCYDVYRRIVEKEGDDIKIEFSANTTVSTSTTDISGYQEIILVDRKNGGSTFVTALKAPTTIEDKLLDNGSIYFATGTTPKWTQKSQTLQIFPAPTATDTARIYYIPEYSIVNWNAGTSSIQYFPQKYFQYVALYGAIRLLNRKLTDIDLSSDITPMATFSDTFTTATTFSAVQASAPTITTVSYTPASTVNPDVPTPISISTTVTSAAPVHEGSAPTFTAPTPDLLTMNDGTLGNDTSQKDFRTWFESLGDLIEDEEDTELANSQISKIGAYVNAYQAQLSTKQAELNANTTHYQALVQQENQSKQDANRATLQTITNDLQKAQANLSSEQQTAQLKSSNAQAKALQDAQQTVQAIISDNQAKIQKYQAELTSYTNEVQAYTQKIGAEAQIYQQKIQKYQQDLQKFAQDIAEKKLELERKTKDYEWLSTNYNRLRAEYEQALGLTPSDQGQQQRG